MAKVEEKQEKMRQVEVKARRGKEVGSNEQFSSRISSVVLLQIFECIINCDLKYLIESSFVKRMIKKEVRNVVLLLSFTCAR
jgi:hypothetical protein